jgi:metallo-beta-lactamase family protein
MATGGRVLNYIKRYAPDPRHTLLFAGYQAGGTRGAHLTGGVKEVKIHGAWHAVRAEVLNLNMLSAHADAGEIMQWLSGFTRPPKTTFIVHGEPDASDTLRQRIGSVPSRGVIRARRLGCGDGFSYPRRAD